MGQWLPKFSGQSPEEKEETSLQKGEVIIQRAVEADGKKNYSEALELYSKGISLLIHACKHEILSYPTRDEVQSKCEKYLERCDELKVLIEEEEKKEDEKRYGNVSAIYIVKPDGQVKFDNVIGLSEVITTFKEHILLPAKFPHMFKDARKPLRSILLYGPPGSGKTLSVKALGNECEGITMLSASSSDFISKYVGESQQIMAAIFEVARAKAPSIVFIDDIDQILESRSRNQSNAVAEVRKVLLTQISRIEKQNEAIVFIAAASMPWALDEACLKMFKKKLFTSMPDWKARQGMLKCFVEVNEQLCLSDDDVQELSDKTEGYSGADMSILIRDALMQPVRQIQKATHFKKTTVPVADDSSETTEVYSVCSPDDPDAVKLSFMDVPQESLHLKPVTMADVLSSLSSMKPSVYWKEMEKFEAFSC